MARNRDPVQARADDDRDLYGVSTWEVRSVLDRVSVGLYGILLSGTRFFLVLLGLAILAAQLAVGTLASPSVGLFTLLSIVPALGLAAYVWHADVTTGEPVDLLLATFVLAVLFAGFAAVLNTATDVTLTYFGLTGGTVGFAVQIAVFFVVVGPVEESVKLLAVRLYAYPSDQFDAVIDGAVYGAVAGLGFATIENAVYIAGEVAEASDPLNLVAAGGAITAVRALAGPGHVIYSALAGYYLGLAKFNRERAGPIVVKGLLVAAVVHAAYNSLAGVVPSVVAGALDVSWILGFIAFVVVYDSVIALVLLRKLSRYRTAYRDAHDEDLPDGPVAELTEFER
ncbi:MAG: PrsW family intramembrane metalloprotease [Haloarculaceae archaeon]